MDIKNALDQTIAPHRILEHPFYQSWNEGTLPWAALASYATEYGAFIDKVAEGWEACDWSPSMLRRSAITQSCGNSLPTLWGRRSRLLRSPKSKR